MTVFTIPEHVRSHAQQRADQAMHLQPLVKNLAEEISREAFDEPNIMSEKLIELADQLRQLPFYESQLVIGVFVDTIYSQLPYSKAEKAMPLLTMATHMAEQREAEDSEG